MRKCDSCGGDMTHLNKTKTYVCKTCKTKAVAHGGQLDRCPKCNHTVIEVQTLAGGAKLLFVHEKRLDGQGGFKTKGCLVDADALGFKPLV